MKHLLILRHAKSSWKDDALSDHDRPLNQRGKRQAPRVGDYLRQQQWIPDCAVSSTAKRAMKTAQAVVKASCPQLSLVSQPQLYLAAPASYFAVVQQLPDDAQRALIVGHNPGIEQFVNQLSGQAVVMKTATLASIEADVASWEQIQAHCGRLLDVWTPPREDWSE